LLDGAGLPAQDQGAIPERLIFRIRMLLGRDHNEISQAMITTKTTRSRKGKHRSANVETDVDITKGVTLKLEKAIEEWDGIQDANGESAPITTAYIDLLPAWMQNDLTNVVNDMSSLDEEEEEE